MKTFSVSLVLAFWIFPVSAFSAAPAYDLDQDGQPDSDMAVVRCGDALCLQVTSRLLNPPINVSLPIETGARTATRIQPIGRHTNRKLSNVAVYYSDRDNRPSMVVFDVETAASIARAKAPAGIDSTYYDFAGGPALKSYPFMVPPYGTPSSQWSYMCIFNAGASSRCGTGFSEVSIIPPDGIPGGGPGYFREVGGYLADLDGDGYEDINIIYHWLIHTISPNPSILRAINTISYNVSGTGGFHSGRNYGVHTAVASSDGRLRTIVLGGIPVNIYSDHFCNVSRFVAVLDSIAGQPNTRRMAWSNYFGFHSNHYEEYVWQRYLDGTMRISRAGQFSDGCVERFSDGRSKIGSEPVVIVNYFRQRPGGGITDCRREQYGYYFPEHYREYVPPLDEQWYACSDRNRRSTGDWAVQAFRERDGVPLLADSVQHFVWGWSDKIYPGGETIYFVQDTPANASTIDFGDIRQPTIQMRALDSSARWVNRGGSPVVGIPFITFEAPYSVLGGARGVGSYTGYAELVHRDVDGDGLEDILFRDRAGPDYTRTWWVGWSVPSGAWEIKEDLARTLTIDLTGPGSDLSSVSSDPASITCTNRRCTGTFLAGTEVTLGASAASGYRFVNFTGDSVCGSGTFTMDQNHYCVVNYDYPTASALNLDCSGGTQAFGYAATDQSFTLPSSCPDPVSVTAKLWGAGGAANGCGAYSYLAPCSWGGGGGFATGTFMVNPGDTFTVIAGQGGVHFDAVRTYGGGGPGGRAGGGGRSAIRRGSEEMITAGGGGGAGEGPGHAAGTPFTGRVYAEGAPFLGGSATGSLGGGGGGAGWIGGPASISTGPGGGGGSNYVSRLLTNASTMPAVGNFAPNSDDRDYVSGAGMGGSGARNGGNGRVVINWGPPPSGRIDLDCLGGSQAFAYAGGDQSFSLPSNCPTPVLVNARLWGAGGGGNGCGVLTGRVACSSGGGGGFATGTFVVNPGDTFTVITGRGGVYFNAVLAYGGGGPGGNSGGGGRSAIRKGSDEIITAGGGGGAGGAPGQAAGTTFTGDVYAPGSPFLGGSATGSLGGGGGGGGYMGGPASTRTGGGGGGSNYVSALLADAATIAGSGSLPANTSDPDYVGGIGVGAVGENNGGNGLVLIAWISAGTPD